jgi:hypothetical protein
MSELLKAQNWSLQDSSTAFPHYYFYVFSVLSIHMIFFQGEFQFIIIITVITAFFEKKNAPVQKIVTRS